MSLEIPPFAKLGEGINKTFTYVNLVETVTKLEGLFRAAAHAAGFTYAGAVECKNFSSLETE